MGYQFMNNNAHNYSVVNSTVNGEKKTIIIKDNKVIINGKKYNVPDTWKTYKTNVVNGRVYIDGHDVEKELTNDGEVAINNFDATWEAKQHPHHNYNDVPFYTDRNFKTITGLESQIKKAEKEEEALRETARQLAEVEEQKKEQEKEAALKSIEENIRKILYPYYGTITDLDAFMKEIYGFKLADIIEVIYEKAGVGKTHDDYTAIYKLLSGLEIERRKHDGMPYNKFSEPETTATDIDDGKPLEKPKKKNVSFLTALSRLFK